MKPIFDPEWIFLCAICFLVIAGGCAAAVFSERIKDTLGERFFLCGMSLGSVATAYRIAQAEFVTDGFVFFATMAAGYVLVILWKHRPEAWRRKS